MGHAFREPELLNSENFNKVSPYSIKNLSGYAFKVVSSKQSKFELNDEASNEDSFIRDEAQPFRLSVLINDGLEI